MTEIWKRITDTSYQLLQKGLMLVTAQLKDVLVVKLIISIVRCNDYRKHILKEIFRRRSE